MGSQLVLLQPTGWAQLYRCGCVHEAPVRSALPRFCPEHSRMANGDPEPTFAGQPQPRFVFTGRPSKYSDEVATTVLNLIRSGWLSRDFDGQKPRLKLLNMGFDHDEAEELAAALPAKATITRWRQAHADFRTRYAQARADWLSDGADEEMLEIADDATNDYVLTDKGYAFDNEHVNRSKVRIGTRQWLMERLTERYGDKLTLRGDPKAPLHPPGRPQVAMTDEQLERILAEHRGQLVHSQDHSDP